MNIKDIIACKKALKWWIKKRRERTRRRSQEKGEEGFLNPTLFGGGGGALFRNLGRSTQKIGHFKLTISTEAIIFLMIFR